MKTLTRKQLKARKAPAVRFVRDASSVLQNRRERLEGLTLEARKHQAMRDLARLRQEEQEEAEREFAHFRRR